MTLESTGSIAVPQQLLAEALVARGIPNGAEVAASLGDLTGCMATVQWWDDRTAHKTPGLLVHMLQTGQARNYVGPPKMPVHRSSSELFWETVAQLKAEGFADHELRLAASARLARRVSSIADLHEHMQATYPWLYTNKEDQ